MICVHLEEAFATMVESEFELDMDKAEAPCRLIDTDLADLIDECERECGSSSVEP